MNNNKIKILDCTLRDGGYYNNWDFDYEVVKNYLNSMENSKIDIVEIGFRSLPKNEFMGPFYYSTDKYLKSLNISKKFDLAVMINANEWIFDTEETTEHLIKKYFCSALNSPVDIVRVAININKYQEGKSIIKLLKSLGYTVGFNLMQAQGKTFKEYENLVSEITSWKLVDVLYFADSLGNMEPDEIKFISNIFAKNFHQSLGIHTHNNKGMALINTMTAIQNGIKWCDATILGMGRGAGNLFTETLLTEAFHRGIHVGEIENLDLTIIDFEKLKKKLGWGSNHLYHYAANNNIHPTYVQNLSKDEKYSKIEIFEILKKLKNKKPSSFNASKLQEITFDNTKHDFKGKWDATNWLSGQNVLLVGSGESIKKYSRPLLDYIKQNKLKVIFLNINKYLPSNIGYATIIANHTRVLYEAQYYKKLNHKIILPLSRFKEQFGKELKQNQILDYGLAVENDCFEISPNGCKIFSSIVLAYSLAVITQANANKIFLVGFDGYLGNDHRNYEINQIFKKYTNLNNSIPLEALTPTNYFLKQGSIFSPEQNSPNFALIIPARYKSTRFPGKPLANLLGKTVIQRVWEKCIKAVNKNDVFIATDDEKIREHCIENGMNVIMTSENCNTGTDRLFEVSLKLKKDFYINVQGDEPLINPDDIKLILNKAKKFPEKIFNGMSSIKLEEDYFSLNVPKVVVDNNNKLLYMSRSPIPGNKNKRIAENAKKQICIYSFPFKALENFGLQQTKSNNENEEDIEILRFVDLGYDVEMIDLEGSYTAIDTEEDLNKAENFLKNIK